MPQCPNCKSDMVVRRDKNIAFDAVWYFCCTCRQWWDQFKYLQLKKRKKRVKR